MESAAKNQNPNMGLRWLTFFLIVLNITWSYFVEFLPGARSMKAVSDQYPSLFTPAPFTFSIWGLIYATFFIYGLAQLLPSARGKWIYDHLAGPVILLQLMGIFWVAAFAYAFMTTSYAIILVMLVTSASAFARAKQSMINPAYSRALTVPFSLLLGWLCVAFIANTSVYLLYLGVDLPLVRMAGFTALMVGVAFVLATVLSLVFRDWIIPLVVAWAFFGIYSANRFLHPALAEMALISAIVMGLWGVLYGIYRSARLRQFVQHYRALEARQTHAG